MAKIKIVVSGWIRKNRVEAIIIALILLIGAFFRLYRIDEYMTFLGDEGRDVLIVRRLLVNFDPILIGPRTSIGDMYLGPLYYYLIAPALLLANFSPVGPAVMIALIGVATVFLVWYITREWFFSKGRFGKVAGIIAAGLYAISPVVIVYSKSSWNPNIMPFFALLSIYSIWRTWQKLEFKWLIILGVSFAFVLHSHYLGLLLAPTLGLFWFLILLKINNRFQRRKSKSIGNGKWEIRKFLRNTLAGLVIFAGLMSPLVIFDSRHEWRNFNSMKLFFTERQTTVSARPWNSIPKLWPLAAKIDTRLMAGGNEETGKWLTVGFVVAIILLLKDAFKRRRLLPASYFLLLFWLGFALIGLGLYKQEIYDHYYGFFFAAPFLLLGSLSQSLIDKSRHLGSLLVIFITGYLFVVNLYNNPLKYPPNRQLQRSIEVAQKIMDESNGNKFNLAVLAERNYEGAYQYFLEKENSPVVMIDPQRSDETITDQLFVVCEHTDVTKCDPTHNPKAEVANFGWTKIDKEWQVAGVTLYKLIHY